MRVVIMLRVWTQMKGQSLRMAFGVGPHPSDSSGPIMPKHWGLLPITRRQESAPHRQYLVRQRSKSRANRPQPPSDEGAGNFVFRLVRESSRFSSHG